MRIRSRCGSPATIRRSIAASNPAASRRARCSRPSSRRASKRSARAAWKASRSNITAMLDDRYHRGKFDQISDRADAPIEDALALHGAREAHRLAPPPAARKLVDLWRPLIEDRAGRDLDRLEDLIEDQRQFARCRSRHARRARHGRGSQPPTARTRTKATTTTKQQDQGQEGERAATATKSQRMSAEEAMSDRGHAGCRGRGD